MKTFCVSFCLSLGYSYVGQVLLPLNLSECSQRHVESSSVVRDDGNDEDERLVSDRGN